MNLRTPKQCVLVTGATGFIGKPVVLKLLADPAIDVVLATRDPDALHRRFPAAQCETLCLDILDPRSWSELDLSRYSRLLHLAWGALHDFNCIDHMTVHLPCHLAFLHKALAEGIGSLTVAGSCLEYGLRDGCLNEDVPTAPVTQYGLAKDSLRRSLELVRAERPFALKWIRVFYLYGPGQQPKSLLAQLDAAISRGERRFDMSQGTQLRDYLPVEEAADQIVKIFRHPTFEGIVNCASGEPISVRQLVEARLEERGATMELRVGMFSYPKYEPFGFWADNQRVQQIMRGDSR
jgi:nucleoside-diphosphate-sugar epimerase